MPPIDMVHAAGVLQRTDKMFETGLSSALVTALQNIVYHMKPLRNHVTVQLAPNVCVFFGVGGGGGVWWLVKSVGGCFF